MNGSIPKYDLGAVINYGKYDLEYSLIHARSPESGDMDYVVPNRDLMSERLISGKNMRFSSFRAVIFYIYRDVYLFYIHFARTLAYIYTYH